MRTTKRCACLTWRLATSMYETRLWAFSCGLHTSVTRCVVQKRNTELTLEPLEGDEETRRWNWERRTKELIEPGLAGGSDCRKQIGEHVVQTVSRHIQDAQPFARIRRSHDQR